jgi:low affinity Fe/Cu permease
VFDRFAAAIARATGSAWAFALALAVVVVWFAVGLLRGFSDTHQLVINTGTTIVTFLMVFLIQATQNRDQAEMLCELRELVRAVPEADERVIPAEAD